MSLNDLANAIHFEPRRWILLVEKLKLRNDAEQIKVKKRIWELSHFLWKRINLCLHTITIIYVRTGISTCAHAYTHARAHTHTQSHTQSRTITNSHIQSYWYTHLFSMFFSFQRSVEIYQQERRRSCHIQVFFTLVSRMTVVFCSLFLWTNYWNEYLTK